MLENLQLESFHNNLQKCRRHSDLDLTYLLDLNHFRHGSVNIDVLTFLNFSFLFFHDEIRLHFKK